MKKFFLFVLSALSVFFLIACGQRRPVHPQDAGKPSVPDHSSVDTHEQNGGGDPVEHPADQGGAGGLKMLCGATSFNRHFGTDSGYYYFSQYDRIGSDLTGSYLMYIDYGTKREVYLCSDSSCRHNTEDCSSVFSGREFGIDCLVFANDDYLYVLNRDYDMDGSSSVVMGGSTSAPQVEGQTVELYRMGFDGSGRQKIFSFPRGTTLEDIVFGDGEDFWFVTKSLSFDIEDNMGYTASADRALVKYDASENRLTDRISLGFEDKLYRKVIGADGKYFILSAIAYPDGMTRDEVERLSEGELKKIFEKSATVFEALDADSGDKRELYAFSNKTGETPSYAVIDGAVFLGDTGKGGIIRVDLASGEKTDLSDTAQNRIVYILKDSVCCLGTDQALYFTDVKTGKTCRCALANKSTGWNLKILSDTASRALVIYDCDGKANSDGSFTIYGMRYALIDKADLYAGRADYQEIKMAGSGM